MKKTVKITVRGIVQGVGFRPFIHKLALRHKLTGKVYNKTGSVYIEAQGEEKNIRKFYEAISEKKPFPAVISDIKMSFYSKKFFYRKFSIEKSKKSAGIKLVSPDLAICPECKKELLDRNNRRYGYPFINCTNCGPRFTIINNMPYDRENTTMGKFIMCKKCAAEYSGIRSRRYHAEPNACSSCGPAVFLKGESIPLCEGGEAVEKAAELLRQGAIIAVKGIGGFHLACDAYNAEAVERLKERKKRSKKPLAVMCASIEAVNKIAHADEREEKLLNSPQAPIVLLKKRDKSPAAAGIAEGLAHIGVFMAYTPLHILLFRGGTEALVMTSGNITEEPIQFRNDEAYIELGEIADFFLFHDRDISIPADDSVIKPYSTGEVFIRRSRGYAPAPVFLDRKYPDTIGTGGLLKNTACFIKGNAAIMSQHIGDLENKRAYEYFESTINDFTSFYKIKPAAVCSDIHPDYMSTGFAEEYAASAGVSHLKIQHHYAHMLSVMAENGVSGPVIGIVFDGTGLGSDLNSWGGEFLTGDFSGYTRHAHFKYRKMPGGDAASKEAYRMAISLMSEFMDASEIKRIFKNKETPAIIEMLEKGVNCPLTSSAGRIFDAAAAIIGACKISTYEAEAPMKLEAFAHMNREDTCGKAYSYGISDKDGILEIDIVPALKSIIAASRSKKPEYLSAVFHNTMSKIVLDTCERIRGRTGIETAALSGGVFQNTYLLEETIKLLKKSGFNVLLHNKLSPNDSSIALGQAVYAAKQLQNT